MQKQATILKIDKLDSIDLVCYRKTFSPETPEQAHIRLFKSKTNGTFVKISIASNLENNIWVTLLWASGFSITGVCVLCNHVLDIRYVKGTKSCTMETNVTGQNQHSWIIMWVYGNGTPSPASCLAPWYKDSDLPPIFLSARVEKQMAMAKQLLLWLTLSATVAVWHTGTCIILH